MSKRLFEIRDELAKLMGQVPKGNQWTHLRRLYDLAIFAVEVLANYVDRHQWVADQHQWVEKTD